MSLPTRYDSYSARVAVPSDTVDEVTISKQLPDAIFVTGAGNVVVVSDMGAVVTITGVALNTVIPLRHSRINLTGTTATGIFCLFQRTA